MFMSMIRHKPLPRKEFPGGHMYFIKRMRTNVVVLHNNDIIGYNNKVKRYKSAGLWRINGGP